MTEEKEVEKFSYEKYIELVRNGNLFETADKYKADYIPQLVYKYMGGIRSEMLKNEKLWASNPPILNDPFEFKVVYANLAEDIKKEFYEDIIYRNEVISLSGNPLDKLMWAHYGNSHKGICCEYYVENKSRLCPIFYTNKRMDISETVEQWFDRKGIIIKNEEEMKPEDRALIARIGMIMNTKDDVWNYEHEYRIITRNHQAIEEEDYDRFLHENGSLHKTSDYEIGLRLKRIILGMNCSEEDVNEVQEIISAINESRCGEIMKTCKYAKDTALKVMKDEDLYVSMAQIEYDNNLNISID